MYLVFVYSFFKGSLSLSYVDSVLVICCFSILPAATFLFVLETAIGLLSSVEGRNISANWGRGEQSRLMNVSFFIPENSNPLMVYL